MNDFYVIYFKNKIESYSTIGKHLGANGGENEMAKNNKILVPEAREGLNQLKADVMKAKGYDVNRSRPDNVKYEIANELGIPFSKGYNGKLTSKEAG